MAYELIFKFDGVEIDSTDMQEILARVRKANQRADWWHWNEAIAILEFIRACDRAEVIESLGARIETTARYDHVKPRIKSRKTQ